MSNIETLDNIVENEIKPAIAKFKMALMRANRKCPECEGTQLNATQTQLSTTQTQPNTTQTQPNTAQTQPNTRCVFEHKMLCSTTNHSVVFKTQGCVQNTAVVFRAPTTS